MAPNTLSTEQPISPEHPPNTPELSDELAAGRRLAHAPPGEEICITGLTGRFPESENVHELRDNLFGKKDLITSDNRRWDLDKVNPDLPKASGKMNGLSKFDASFFSIHSAQAHGLDPMTRLFLEKSYEAIVDAGVNPAELRGTRTGVFVGACFSESEPNLYLDTRPVNGRCLLASTRISYSARIAYWLQVNGPAYTVDSACSSSLYAMDNAYAAIRDGLCDQAIVAGAALVLKPNLSMQFFRLGVLSSGARCKTFDQDADGYSRSEAVSAVFLQKSRDARRVYATVVYSKTNNDGYKEQGITFPSSAMQRRLLADFYDECEIDPASLAWVEAHGTGTTVGDPEECAALVSVFCPGRDTPLPIGSIKSNMGHTEPASGLCSIAKVIIAMETGLIPPNINFRQPKASITGLMDGRLQVVTEPQPWDGGLVGVNSFGFGGANAHVCLRWNDKTKVDGGAPADKLPRLVVISGRTRKSVVNMIDDLTSRPVDAELAYLYHAVAAHETPAHVYRGFAILGGGKPVRHVQYYDKSPRPVWIAIPALDTLRWPGMGRALLALPPFAGAVAECQAALGTAMPVSLRDLVAADSLDEPANRAVAAAVVQIALVSVLRAVGVECAAATGAGSGELAAGFAAGCLTAGQAMRIAFQLAIATAQRAEGREERLAKMLEKTLPTPLQRSQRWLGAGGPVTAASLARSLLAPTPLDAALRAAPKDAVVVHVTGGDGDGNGGDGRVKRAVHVTLLSRGRDAVEGLLLALGRVYSVGGNNGAGLRLAALYPAVPLPVSRGTPMISPLVDWNHDRDWYTDYYYLESELKTRETVFTISVEKEQYEFYKGHVIDGRNLFPATGYLFLTWECMIQNSAADGKVAFDDIRFHRATTLPATGNLELMVSIQKTSGNFEVVEGGVKVVTGRISFVPTSEREELEVMPPPRAAAAAAADDIQLSAKDIYKELRLRGYNYGGLFRGLVSSDLAGERGKLRWADDNWVAFMDNMLQMQILSKDTRALYVPTSIDRLTIDASKHLRIVQTLIEASGDAEPVLDVVVVKEVHLIRSGGITIRGLNASVINQKKSNAEPVLEAYRFLPFKIDEPTLLPLTAALRACVHLGLENRASAGVGVKVAELVDSEHVGAPLAAELAALLADLPLLQAEIVLLSTADAATLESSLVPRVRLEPSALSAQDGCAFVLASRLLRRPAVLRDALAALADDGFLLAREAAGAEPWAGDERLQLLAEYRVGDEVLVLLRKRCPPSSLSAIRVREQDGAWVAQTQKALEKCASDQRVVLFAQDEPLSGLLGAFNCLRREHTGENARCVLILDSGAPAFDLELPLYRDQLALDLAVNIYQNGCWGSYRHLPLERSAQVAVRHAYANVTTLGDLSSFRWLEGSLDYPGTKLHADNEMVQVYVSALNFRDVMTASGKLAAEVISDKRIGQDSLQGLEFAGRTADGRRVMGMAPWGALSTMVSAISGLLMDIPDGWTMEDAATVPVVYGTAMYALYMKGGMKRGDTVLIHAGSGGVGQAAIQLALHTGAVVFTTVGTAEKRAFIKQRFPTLTDSHIGNSRDTSFEQLVMRETDGRGVDLVLNSLAEEKLLASVRCLAIGGRFLEIGKFDMAANSLLGMDTFLKETSFHGIFLDTIFSSNDELRKEIHDILEAGVRDGSVQPLTRTIFPSDQVEQAFRFMGAGKHIGKVLLTVREEEPVKTIVPEVVLRNATPRFCCRPLGTYIIAGGLGGFGLELADWLVLRGARRLVLVSRSGLRTGYQASRIRAWRSYGADVVVSTEDIQTERGVERLLNAANQMGPVAGIFNLAVVLRDAIFENQTNENFAAAAGPKATATRLLDTASRRLCPRLEQFVVFSSVSCGRGNAGQTSYGAANSAMERICERRAEIGLPALAVQWGAVGQVGLVADMRDDDREVVIGGTLPQRIGSCLAALDGFLRQPQPVVASMVVAEKLAGGGAASMLQHIAGILGIWDLKSVSYQTTLAELGMDSMTAVEIKQTLEREYQVFLTPVEIRGLTFARVVELSEAEKVEAEEQVIEPNVAGIAELARGLGDASSAYAPTVALPSKPSTAAAAAGRTLLMIPGVEGVAAALAPLARNVDARAICLQGDWVNDRSETAHGMALMLLPHALRELGTSTDFRLLGYSFGGLVALHLAALLEADAGRGRRGQVFLVDGAPDYLQRLLLRMVSADATDDALQVNLLVGMVDFVRKQAGSANEKLREQIAALDSWSARLDFALTLVPGDLLSGRYLRDAADSALRRLKAVKTFDWPSDVGIESPVTLLRPTYKALKLPMDLGVGKYCKNPVEVHLFDETHVSILESLEMATIINNQLTQAVSEEKVR